MKRLKNLIAGTSAALLALFLPDPCFSASALDPWISNAWQKRIALTNLSPIGSGALTDFPVLVILSNAAWLDNLLPDGGDLTFAGMDGKQLFHEIEQFDHTGKNLVAWVCLPTYSNNTEFYLYWKNPGTLSFSGSNTSSNLVTTFTSLSNTNLAACVWDSNFAAVWHFANTAGVPLDSTRYNLRATAISTNFASNVAGIGSSRGYFSTPGYADPGLQTGFRTTNHKSVPFLANRLTNNVNLTASFWFKHQTCPSNTTYMGTNINAYGLTNTNVQLVMMALAQGNSTGGGDGMYLAYDQSARPTAALNTRAGTSTGIGYLTNQANVFGPTLAPYSNWGYHAVAGAFTAGKLTYVVNDRSWDVYSGTFPYNASLQEIYVFGGNGGGGAPNWSRRYSPWGWGDEYRLSVVQRSSNWMLTEYSNVITTTNMALYNGATSGAITNASNLFVAITNSAAYMMLGSTLRGYHISPFGFSAVVLLVSNAGGIVSSGPVTSDTTREWSATPALPIGAYTACLLATNGAGQALSSALVSFSIVASSTLTVRTAASNGASFAGERLLGPGISDSGVRTNDANGEATFANLFSGLVYGLTNFAPTRWGAAPVTMTYTMAPSNVTLVWYLTPVEAAGLATNSNASGRLDTVVFLPNQSPYLALSIPQATNASVRVVVTATPLAGGRKVSLFTGTADPAFPYIQIPSEKLRQSMSAGTWILEFQFPQTRADKSKTPTTRRMLFYAQ